MCGKQCLVVLLAGLATVLFAAVTILAYMLYDCKKTVSPESQLDDWVTELPKPDDALKTTEAQRIAQINNGSYGWTAEINPSALLPMAFLSLLGQPQESSGTSSGRGFTANDIKFVKQQVLDNTDPIFLRQSVQHMEQLLKTEVEIPWHFDARERWHWCQSLHGIINQGACGSCWAESIASTLSDRYCIHSNGSLQILISAQDILECCETCGGGCTGGYTPGPHNHWVRSGIVTGGAYRSSEGCKPSRVPNNCGNPCPAAIYKLGAQLQLDRGCKRSCRPFYSKDYESDKRYGKYAYFIGNPQMAFEAEVASLMRQPDSLNSVAEAERNIYQEVALALLEDKVKIVVPKLQQYGAEALEKLFQLELMTNGPFAVSFNVHHEFLHYKSGVYVPTSHKGSRIYGHIVRLLGWGEAEVPSKNGEKGRKIKYWLCANSWGRDWGEHGLFRLARSQKILDAEVYTGIPLV